MKTTTWLRQQWDRAAAAVLMGLGLVGLLLGWKGVSDTPFPAEQIPYVISGGLLGVFLLGVGAVFWLSADLRDEWRTLDRIEAALTGPASAEAGPS